jgi:hypothetical protein
MINEDFLRQVALSLPESEESPHFEKISFRVKKKIFATYDVKNQLVCVKLSIIDQDVFVLAGQKSIYPVNNKWGLQGWTLIDLNQVNIDLLTEAITNAYCEVAPKQLVSLVRNIKNQ